MIESLSRRGAHVGASISAPNRTEHVTATVGNAEPAALEAAHRAALSG
jgi:hypothetical protein